MRGSRETGCPEPSSSRRMARFFWPPLPFFFCVGWLVGEKGVDGSSNEMGLEAWAGDWVGFGLVDPHKQIVTCLAAALLGLRRAALRLVLLRLLLLVLDLLDEILRLPDPVVPLV